LETETPDSKIREIAEEEAIKLAKEKSGLGRFLKTWNFSVVHLEDRFQIDGRWVKQGIYRMNERGQWQKAPGK
jgi:predicted FMN-binding regulatory protein PaiB